MSKLAWFVFVGSIGLLFILLLSVYLAPFLVQFNTLMNGLAGF